MVGHAIVRLSRDVERCLGIPKCSDFGNLGEFEDVVEYDMRGVGFFMGRAR